MTGIKTIKLLNENIRVNFCILGLGNGFLDNDIKPHVTLLNWNSSKLEALWFEGHNHERKDNPQTWEKIFANDITDKGLKSNIKNSSYTSAINDNSI